MPILSVQLGLSSTSFLLYKSDEEMKFHDYPYSYIPIYGYTSKKEFYLDIFDFVSGEFGLNHTECDLIVSALLDPTIGDYPIKSTKLVTNVLSTITDFSYVFVDPCSLVQNDQFFSASPYTTSNSIFKLGDPEKANYLANSMVYINSVPQKDFDIFDRDDTTRFLAENIVTPNFKSNKVVFTGDRYSNFETSKSLAYLLAVDLLKLPGYFEIYIDTHNQLANVAHLASFKPDTSHLIDDIPLHFVGSLVNAPGGVECLIKTSVGTSQMIDLDSETLQLIPLEKTSDTTIVARNQRIGNLEHTVSGGDIGLIIDTRNKESSKLTTELEGRHKKYREWQHVIQDAINQL